MNKKTAIARWSIVSNSALILMKVVAGIASGSVSILSEAIHSFMDLLAAIIAFFSVRISDTPADTEHPYGHGKFENISGVVEALLIFVAAFWIIYEAIEKLLHPSPVEALPVAIAIMAVSAVVNIIVSKRLYKVARETDSIALEADALHLKTDVYTSAGVAVGLTLIWVSGYTFLDPIIAILVALLILKESFVLFRKAYGPLLDVSLPQAEVDAIREKINMHCTNSITYHDLRTRKAGMHKYVDFHLNLPPMLTVKEAHTLCDIIEEDIRKSFPGTEVTIHVEHP